MVNLFITNFLKKYFVIFLLALFPILCVSQNKIGVFGGVSLSALSDGILKSTYLGSNSYSFHIGGLYNLEIKEKIAFRPKIVYSQQGDREDLDDNINYKLSYINVPLNFKFFNKPYLLIGPQIGFLINTKKGDIDYGDLPTFDYGATIGIGYDIKDFFIEFNMYQGINTLIEVEFLYEDISATNTVLQLSFGYHL